MFINLYDAKKQNKFAFFFFFFTLVSVDAREISFVSLFVQQ